MITRKKNKSQHAICSLCGNSFNSNLLICVNCNKDPFNVELLRDKLATNSDYKKFKSTYINAYNEIRNFNTQSFWDEKFLAPEKLEDQDLMTKEKINFIITCLPKNSIKFLDIGIGQGYLEQGLKSKGIYHFISGIDISKTSIKRAKQKFKGSFIVGDLSKVTKYFKKGSFDIIVAIEVIEHISPRQVLGFLRKLKSLLSNKGSLIISTPLNENLHLSGLNPSAHLRQYSIPILESELKIIGFKVIEEKTFFAFNNFYKGKKILSRVFRSRWKPNNVVVRAVKIK